MEELVFLKPNHRDDHFNNKGQMQHKYMAWDCPPITCRPQQWVSSSVCNTRKASWACLLCGKLTHISCDLPAAAPPCKWRVGPRLHRETPSRPDTPARSPPRGPACYWFGSRSGIQLQTPDLQTGTRFSHTYTHTHTDKNTVNALAKDNASPLALVLRLSHPTGH